MVRGMETYQIVRLSKETAAVRGVLLKEWVPICLTLEPPWNKNEKNASCIPPGWYECERRPVGPGKTGGLPDTFEVENVKDRDGILFHVGNFADDTEGCILLGESFGTGPNGVPMITSSKSAFVRFHNSLAGQERFGLMILDILKRGEGSAWIQKSPGKNRVIKALRR